MTIGSTGQMHRDSSVPVVGTIGTGQPPYRGLSRPDGPLPPEADPSAT